MGLIKPFLEIETDPKKDKPGYVECSPSDSIDFLVWKFVFAGDKAYNIAVIFGISHSSVFGFTDYDVNEVNYTESMEIRFLLDHDKQRSIACGFQKNFPHCNI